jgi:hypothetical protein
MAINQSKKLNIEKNPDLKFGAMALRLSPPKNKKERSKFASPWLLATGSRNEASIYKYVWEAKRNFDCQ